MMRSILIALCSLVLCSSSLAVDPSAFNTAPTIEKSFVEKAFFVNYEEPALGRQPEEFSLYPPKPNTPPEPPVVVQPTKPVTPDPRPAITPVKPAQPQVQAQECQVPHTYVTYTYGNSNWRGVPVIRRFRGNGGLFRGEGVPIIRRLRGGRFGFGGC